MIDLIRIEFDRLIKETENAYQIQIDSENIWLPKSQVNMYARVKAVHVPEWLATEKGLL